jgi:hypothetical protein
VAKKKTKDEIQGELRALNRPDPNGQPKGFDLKQNVLRLALILGLLWLVATGIATFFHTSIPVIIAAVLTLLLAAVLLWARRMMGRQKTIGSILEGADTAEGRKAALERLSSEFKEDDTQAVLARAQLEMQDDPRRALATLEKVNLEQTGVLSGPMVSQVRAMRAMIHLTLGEPQEAKRLVDPLDLSKQQDVKLRAMFATVASEAWARTGQAQKAKDTLELFNPEDAENAELRPQMWRARAFAYAHLNDMKGVTRALKKLSELNPQLLAMFVSAKKVHPLLEREAKQMVMRLGLAPTKMVQRRM